MDYNASSTDIVKQKHGCIVLPIFADAILSVCAAAVDAACDGIISKVRKAGDVTGKRGETLLLPNTNHNNISRILLVGVGKAEPLKDNEFRKLINDALKALLASKAKTATWCLDNLVVNHRNFNWQIRQILLACNQQRYRFTACKSTPKLDETTLTALTFHVDQKSQVGMAELAINEARAICRGIDTQKYLANLPANICTPTYMLKAAEKIAKSHKKISVSAVNEAAMKKLGMGAFLSVAQGSEQSAQLIVVKYSGTASKVKPIVLVGKGVTFDSGGISLKPGLAMDEMKFDMCGAASVLGAIQAASEIGLPLNIVGLMACTENLPSGVATKPGDIVKTMSGQTVEILNTDAEGRLILCDTLTYAERFKPDVVIDVATLTGAIIIALGDQVSGLMSNHPQLARDLMAAGDMSGDRLWELPLHEEYHEQLNSNFADIANIGVKGAGSIIAGCFLEKFAKNFHWAHIDIAGVAWLSGGAKGATGRPVPLLVQYLMDRCNK